jgi:hypothetical protein
VQTWRTRREIDIHCRRRPWAYTREEARFRRRHVFIWVSATYIEIRSTWVVGAGRAERDSQSSTPRSDDTASCHCLFSNHHQRSCWFCCLCSTYRIEHEWFLTHSSLTI